MKKAEIQVGGLYLAKVSGKVTTVRVDSIRDTPGWGSTTHEYHVTNLTTGRKTVFRSAAKFRGPAKPPAIQTDRPSPNVGINDSGKMVSNPPIETGDCEDEEGEQCPDPTSTSVPTATSPKPTPGDTVSSVTDSASDEEHPDRVANSEERTVRPTVAPCAETKHGATTSAQTTARSSSTLAAKITASRRTREVGSPVADMTPNDEQEAILAVAENMTGGVLVVCAGAGAGKTATLKMLEQVLLGRGQYTAFNSSLVAEGKTKFVKAKCNTTHSLAFGAVGKQYQHRLNSDRMRSGQVANILGIHSMSVQVPGQVDAKGNPKPKSLSAEYLAGQVMVAVRRFCQSADREVMVQHFAYVDGIDKPSEYQDDRGEVRSKRGRENNDRVRNYLLPFASKMWEDLSRVDGQLPFNHDVYVKIWSLGEGVNRPIISADYIMIDESQDSAPVFLEVIRQQTHALVILVGDSCQAIYEWRGAVDAMRAYPDAPRRLLSQSYRFGQAIADVANSVLATLEEPTDLVMRGMPNMPSRVAKVESPRCYLYRTNAGAIGRVMASIGEGRRPHLIGGGDETVKWVQAAMDLQARPPRGTRHPELCCFSDWKEVVEYAKSDEGSDLRLMVKLVEEFGAEEIRDALKDMPGEEEADLVISTAHKSKGREWDTVKLGGDFPLANKMTDADRRLLYVAATRAKLTLDITMCPPFCGGEDLAWGEGGLEARWVPGIKVKYTQEMPSEEKQIAWLEAKKAPNPQIGTEREDTSSPVPSAEVSIPVPTDATFVWANSGGTWCVRGPANVKLNTRVTVIRRDGSTSQTTLRNVVRQFDDAWVYGV